MKVEMSWFVSSWLAQEKLFLIVAVLKAQNCFIKFRELEGTTLFSYDCVHSMLDEQTSSHLQGNSVNLGKAFW